MSDNKYYSKYNNNIKSYKGFGTVTQRQPVDKTKTTTTINKTFVDNIQVIPPLFKRTYDIDPQDTNGYLNPDNYVNYVMNIRIFNIIE